MRYIIVAAVSFFGIMCLHMLDFFVGYAYHGADGTSLVAALKVLDFRRFRSDFVHIKFAPASSKLWRVEQR